MFVSISLSAGKKLFGPGYSGLEYDYRGLIRLYSNTENMDKMYQYYDVLSHWNEIREGNQNPENILEYLANYKSELTTEQVVQKFFKQD